MSDTERDELVRELRDRSFEVGGHPIALEAVKRSARKMQRRRNLVSGAVAAVVAGVAVPSALAVSNGLDTVEGPADDPTVAASETPAPRPEGPVRLTLDGLERGGDPGIGYLSGRDLVGADGSVTRLDATYRAVTPYADGWLAMSFDGQQAFLDGDGRTLRTQPGSGFVVDAAGSEVAYRTAAESADGRPQLVLAPATGAESAKLSLPVEEDASPVGYVAEGRVVYHTEGEAPQTLVTSPDGTTEVVPGLMVASDASQHGLVTGLTRSTVDGSCSAVVDVDGFDRLWETCDYRLGQLSPDGRYVIGTDAYGDGLGDRTMAVLDARTGDLVARFEQGGDGQVALTALAWESDQAVLAVAAEGTTWTILRMSVDGELTEAVDPVESDPYGSAPFWFSTQP